LEADDILFGDAGNDQIIGGPGIDTMTGGPGDDLFYVDNAGDQVFEDIGGGNDRVLASVDYTLAAGQAIEMLTTNAVGVAPVLGTFAINLTGNEFAQAIWGNAAANVLDGKDNNDALYGFDGNDALIVAGGSGNDTYVVDNPGDVVVENPGQGSDTVETTLASHTLGANVENLVFVGSGDFAGSGNALDNSITGGAGNDTLNGEAGSDTAVYSGARADYQIVQQTGAAGTIFTVTDLRSGAPDGRDTLTGIESLRFSDIILSLGRFPANLNLSSLDGSNGFRLSGALGDQSGGSVASAGDVNGDGFADMIVGAQSADTHGASYVIYGRAPDTAVDRTGTAASQTLAGGAFDDTLSGLGGDDRLFGNGGNDVLTGGAGNDAFIFNTALNALTNVDTVADFNVAQDTMLLDNAVFTALTTTGTLASAAFFIGAAAHDADDRIIYDSATGALSYDPDGTGSITATQFATLSTGLALTNNDFTIV
jgi:serralysin